MMIYLSVVVDALVLHNGSVDVVFEFSHPSISFLRFIHHLHTRDTSLTTSVVFLLARFASLWMRRAAAARESYGYFLIAITGSDCQKTFVPPYTCYSKEARVLP
jgi:hypothetical protein